jgi:hypothetical protein
LTPPRIPPTQSQVGAWRSLTNHQRGTQPVCNVPASHFRVEKQNTTFGELIQSLDTQIPSECNWNPWRMQTG